MWGKSWPEVLGDNTLSHSFLGNLVEMRIVTREHRRTIEGLVRIGIGPWRVHTFILENVAGQTYGGGPGAFSLKVCFAEGRT